MSELTYIDRIKKIKSERRITNDKLSEMTGIPLGTLSKILAGISDSPKLSNMLAICRALDCSLDYIVSGVPENHHNYTLSEGEIALIEHYRRLDSHGSELVALVLDKEYERVTAQSYAPAATVGAMLTAPVTTAVARMMITVFFEPYFSSIIGPSSRMNIRLPIRWSQPAWPST